MEEHGAERHQEDRAEGGDELGVGGAAVRPMAVKNSVMLRPKNSPAGSVRRHVRRVGAGRPVRALRPTITIHHSTTEMSIRQNAMTEPGVSAHLKVMSVELPENNKTAQIIGMIPTGPGLAHPDDVPGRDGGARSHAGAGAR